MRRPPARRRPGPRVALDRSWLAPGLSVVGLLLVASITAGLFGGRLPGIGQGPGGPGFLPPPRATPNLSIVIPAQQYDVLGTILFVKNGNVWSASGTGVRRLSDTRADSSPAWSPDGQSIYLIETRTKADVNFPYQGTVARYTLNYPVIVRMSADGTQRTDIADSLYTTGPGGRYTYHLWYLQPVPDPDGARLALVSDGPDPLGHNPVIQLMPADGGKLTNIGAPYDFALGLADPAWRPDGRTLAYTRYGRSGFSPRHRIAIYTLATKRVANLTRVGYSQPAWSPDGRFLAAVRWDGLKRDIVVLDASNGRQVLAVTDDGHSWAPVWSPAGDAIAFLTESGLDIDLDVVTLAPSGTSFTVAKRLPITSHSLLDGTSRPSWFVPPGSIPTPALTATPGPTATAAPSASP